MLEHAFIPTCACEALPYYTISPQCNLSVLEWKDGGTGTQSSRNGYQVGLRQPIYVWQEDHRQLLQ